MMVTYGLTSEKANELLDKYGLNEIKEKAKRGSWQIFLSQFINFLVILLILAALLSFLLGDRLDGIFILLTVVLNSILGFIQEFKAEKAIEALKKITISKVRVLRDGIESEIDSRFLVPGDIFFVEEGVRVPADGYIHEGINLELTEASLTGESLPVLKKFGGSGDESQVFAGTVVARGRGRIEVATTGMETRFGRIASGLQSIEEEETPLQKKIELLGKQLGIFGIVASLSVLALSIIRRTPVFESILTSISLAVAAVPEGLPAVITIALAIGVQRMSKERAIVRKLTSVEALGATSVIATDKTGTLTKGEMRVKELWFDGRFFSLKDLTSRIPDPTGDHLSDLGSNPVGARRIRDLRRRNPDPDPVSPMYSEAFKKILEVASVCNSASLVLRKDHGSFDILGDSTEGSLLLMVNDLGADIEKLRLEGRLLEEYPFDAQKKTMSVVYSQDGQTQVLTKGAPEVVLNLSSSYLEGGSYLPLDENLRIKIEKSFKESASVGLRMIAFAFRKASAGSGSREETEKNLTFLGFAGIYDPPRSEVKEAVRVCKEAGIRVIMVTGDNPLTANAVASEIGLTEEGDDTVTGKQLESYSFEALKEILLKIRIFARTTPEQKLQIVKAYQALGDIVAVTGDGVNDSLALKQADVGVAMGITGTDVAKEAADIVVTDDNFASIAKAVEEGRVIFENVKGAVKYLLGCNLGEILAVLLGVLFGWPLVFTPLQLLYINLITDGLPALALSITPSRDSVMKKKPRKDSGIISKSDIGWFAEVSFLTAAITLFSFYLGRPFGVSSARTLSFTAAMLVQHLIFLDIWVRDASVLNLGLYRNAFFLTAFFLPIIIQPLLIYTPALAEIFKINSSHPELLMAVVFLSLLTLVVSEARKRR